jgi:hypothetical protein
MLRAGRLLLLALLVCGWGLLPEAGAAARGRVALLVDTSGAMLQTPQVLSYDSLDTCVANGMDGCTFTGNPSLAQEGCNACVRDTINFIPGCATLWTASCRSQYADCIRLVNGSLTCLPSMGLVGNWDTRGDGSPDLAGCDVNGNGQPDDSRLFQTKRTLGALFPAHPEIEFSLWRHAQVEGGQTCAIDADCPDTPGGLSVLTCESIAGTSRCAMDATSLGVVASTAGQCARETWNGAAFSFSCNVCDFATTYERATCEAFGVNRVRHAGLSMLNGTAVNCNFPSPTHPFIKYQGAVWNWDVCDPLGAQRLADFPVSGAPDNLAALTPWIDGAQTPFATAHELRAHGVRPLAASLRDLRSTLLANLSADLDTPCRPYRVVVIASGPEQCETAQAAQAAAAALQNLAFTSGSGVPVTGYDVLVHVIGFGICFGGGGTCSAAQELHGIAAAGGTGSAVLVNTEAQLLAALNAIAAIAAPPAETCNGVDDDCDGATDELAVPGGSPQLYVERTALSWSALTGATGYDAVRGSLDSLRSSGGNFTTAVQACAANDAGSTSVASAETPAPGQGTFYLVRGVNCGGPGSFDSGSAKQAGSRDAEVAASAGACP